MIYPDFPFSEQFTVSDHPGSGYQAKITVYCYPGMCYDFRDIRFHDSQNNIIPYWIESQTDGSTATVWLKLTASKIVIFRWGNGSAVSESNGHDVFDTFSDGSDLTDFDSVESGNSGARIDLVNGNIELEGADGIVSSSAIVSKSTYTNGFEIVIREKHSGTYYNNTGFGSGSVQGTAPGDLYHTVLGDGYSTRNGLNGAGDLVINPDGGTYTSLSENGTAIFSANTYRITQMRYTSDGLIEFIHNGSTVYSVTDTNYLSTNKKIIASQGEYTVSTRGGILYIDYIYVRKYTATEPTFTPLSSQYYLPISAELFSSTAEPQTYIYPIISYNEENEMFQIVGTEKAHPVQMRSLSTGALLTETPTGATITVYVNGTISAETVTVSGFNSTMLRHLITVPATLAATAYDSVEINISYTDGDDVDYEGFAMVNIIPALSYFAASSEITALNDLSSADIVTAVGTALSTSDALRILDIIMSGTFTITTGVGGAFTCTYTSRTDLSTIEFTVDADGQRTGTTVTLV